MNSKVIFIICLLVSGCGKSGSTEAPTEELTCTIVGNTMMCPDGTEYVLPEPVQEPIDVVTEPAVEEDEEAVCERDNRNGRKCRRIK